MQRLPKQLASTELTTGSVIQYTAAANTSATISAATATNKSATARYITITITPSGGVARNVTYQRVIAVNESYVVAGLLGQTVEVGGTISALAEANSAIDLVISGYETNR